MNSLFFTLLIALSPAITWHSPKNQNIGTIQAGKVYRTAFIYQNTGTEAIAIDNVRTTCGCTVPNWSPHPLPPGRQDTLHVVLEKNNRGQFQQKIKVYFAHQRRAEIITLRGIVE